MRTPTQALGLLLSLLLLTGCGSDSGTSSTLTDSVTETSSSDISAQTDEEAILARGTRDQTSRGDSGDRDRDRDRDPAPVTTEDRSIDGTGNAPNDLGATEKAFAEDIIRAYSDGISEPSGEDRPNARAISNAVVAQTEDTPDPDGRTAYLWLWGQFLDHDVTLTHENGTNDFPIEVPIGDVHFDPFATGTQTIPFSRSTFEDGTGTSTDNHRAQVNSITSFIDASMVYGSDEERANALRTFAGGLLATSDGDLPPYNFDGLDNAGGPGSNLFLCGDVRANENLLLTSMHTVFLREHNRIATELTLRYPEMSDEELYQATRKRVGAIIQSITYNEYIPALLGRDALPPYRGYRPDIDPRIGILFATSAYRLGHSQVGTTVQRLDENGEEIADGNLVVADAFFNPSALPQTGIDPLLRGAAAEPSQQTDGKIIDDLRNLLFGPPGAGGLDLSSLNIQRGRDHGMPSYNEVRTFYGLSSATDFTQITTDSDRQNELASVFSSPDQIDPWVGLLAEDSVRGSATGRTLKRILSDQFRRLRDGDRFFYLNDPDLAREREAISGTRLADVIERNTSITELQRNVFFEARSKRPSRPKRRNPDRKFPAPRF